MCKYAFGGSGGTATEETSRRYLANLKKVIGTSFKRFFFCFDYFEILGAGATSLYLSRGLRGETF